ncbi:hypothetical protein CROQUDRAFT_661837 [Cronartium quercuum f. sp. fusiforme G11]|uniref:Wax synthase domain-containing protein n=1 Tax=Cronartium quercuum f. sp. fusiforme G11 TaxID=708437 RepID=A0A9P6NCA5_9BASI|nr:hypothetical protein CROQUDRAFT_661837 [Cronartium quercuum f. sp. fusiforme G11]
MLALIVTFTISQFPLITQAFFLHPYYRQNQNARLIRLGLIPIALVLLASFGFQWRAEAVVDSFTNVFFGAFLGALALRSLIWGMVYEPYYLLSDPNPAGKGFFDRLCFAFSLYCSPRGIGWSFGVPAKPLNQTRMAFFLETLTRFLINMIILIGIVIPLMAIDKSPLGTTLLLRHVATFFAGALAWMTLDILGCILRLIALAFQRNLTHYPFLFDYPIKATNLADFWSRRWHSLVKHIFFETGGRPVQSLVASCIGEGHLSRALGIIGAFSVSGFVHELALYFATSFDPTFCTTLFFASQGLGVILEACFRRLTGLRVDGWPGRVWMFIWLVGWGRPMINSWSEKGVVDWDAMRALFS